MSNKEELAWLAGLIDGEGCINLHIGKPNNNKFVRTDVFVYVGIYGNKESKWLKKIEKILTENNIAYCVFFNKSGIVSIRTMSTEPSLRLCKLIKPYLTIKDKMLDIIENIPGQRVYAKNITKLIYWDRTKEWAEKIDEVHSNTGIKNIKYVWTGKKFLETMLVSAKRYGFVFIEKKEIISYNDIEQYVKNFKEFKK